ncbi:MAG: hypothetical protein V3S41_02650 [Spirochaetia bacterium]
MPSAIRDDDGEDVKNGLESVASGNCVFRGLPFSIEGVVRVGADPVAMSFKPITAKWLVFLHTVAKATLPLNDEGFISPMKGRDVLNEPAATYIIRCTDGSQESLPIRRRHEISTFGAGWGENAFRAVPHIAPRAVPQHHEQAERNTGRPTSTWEHSQTRVGYAHYLSWLNQLHAWENPKPGAEVSEIEYRAHGTEIFILGLSAGDTQTNPLRWEQRRKTLANLAAVLPDGEQFDPTFDEAGRARRTFVTYGPMLEFSVDGVPMGGSLDLPANGGTVDVSWEVASVSIPVSEVDLMINGEVAERFAISDWDAESGNDKGVRGSWKVKLARSSWLALLVRGHYREQPEIIVCHSSAVMARVEGTEFYVEYDAVSILEQIEARRPTSIPRGHGQRPSSTSA